MERATLSALNAARHARQPVLLLTPLAGGAPQIIAHDAPREGALGAAVARAFASGQPARITLDGADHFLNPYLPAPRLVLIGAVHIAQALAPMAARCGLDVTIIDPRTAFATPERFAGQRVIADWPEDALSEQPLDRWTALAALTHDPKIDDDPLSAALRAGCFYVGALGSRKTHAARLERLHASGLTPAQTDRICAPIGLDIAAANPAEIAVAVLAEIIAALRRQDRPA